MGKSRRRKNKNKQQREVNPDAPRIVVIRRGIVTPEIKQLAQNLRAILSPNCATRLKEGSRQKLRDFTVVSDVLGLTHLIVLSQSANAAYLKIANFPAGPTLTFQVNKLSLIADIAKHTKNPHSFDSSIHSPVLVLNGFSRNVFKRRDDKGQAGSSFDEVMGFVTDTLNKMIAPIDVATTKIQSCKRAILFHKQKGDNVFSLRHYAIDLVDCNTSAQVKDLLTRKAMKDLIAQNADFQDIETKLSGANEEAESESDGEVVELDNISPQNVIAKNKYGVDLSADEVTEAKNSVAIRLTEIGPRLSLTLVKVQGELFTGPVIYHKFVTKTAEELEENKKMEQVIVKKRRLETERVMKLYEKHVKKKPAETKNEDEEPKQEPKQKKKRNKV